jgi:hypothetical protein
MKIVCMCLEDMMDTTEMTFTDLTLSLINGLKSILNPMVMEYGQRVDIELQLQYTKI